MVLKKALKNGLFLLKNFQLGMRPMLLGIA